VEEIARRHALAPSTVSFHLKKLEQAGLVSSSKEQYYVVVQANEAMFDTTLREIVSAPPAGKELQDGRMEEYRRRVLDAFFRNGRLEKLPAQHKKRLIVLEQFAARFEPERRYPEQEVTALIVPLFDDYCTIRRQLVDEGLIRREGSSYWREGSDNLTGLLLPAPGKTALVGNTRKSRADMKRACRQNAPAMGVYQIMNRANGRVYVGSSTNLDGARNRRLFQLKMGKVVFSRELQKDLNEFGAGSFEFSVLAVLDKMEACDNIEQSLAALELHWQKKLQPFGERGYNSANAYQRSAERLQLQCGVELN
jgi:hypothetical protein